VILTFVVPVFCCNPETQALANPYEHPEFAMSSEEIASLLYKYKAWLTPRRGGITISGGEPLLQADFVADVFRRVRNQGMTTCLDTACFGNPRRWDKVLPYTDTVLLCLKGMDNQVAGTVAQVHASEMAKSKEFARYIRDNYPEIRVTLRWVLLKDLTDTASEIDALANFALELGASFHAVELLPYHELGRDKYNMLQLEYPLGDMSTYRTEDALRVQAKLEAAGIATILSR